MKRIVLLINFLTLTLFAQAQEQLNYKINGQTIEFSISDQEMYVEFAKGQKETLQGISKNGLDELSNNAALLNMPELDGSFKTRKQSLQSKVAQSLQRIEPVLIYTDGTRQIAKGELNIQLKPNASIKNVLKGKTFTTQANEFEQNLYLVKLNLETTELFELVNQLQKDARVAYAEPNFIRMLTPHTNDPFYPSQWSIRNQGYLGGTVDADMDVDNAWGYVTGNGVKVAVIDEGVDLSHPDLTPNLLPGHDATGLGSNGAPDESRNDAHGTACAGMIAALANNNTGLAGVAYNAQILPVRIAYSSGRSWITNDNWIANGINWAWQNGADVLSNSYGGGSYSNTIANAINSATNNGRSGKGSVVLFSAGNDNNSSVSFPSSVSSAIAVGASSMCDTRKSPSSCDGESWWGSNYGTGLDVVAPGVKIYTTDISGSSGYSSGDYTSTYNGTSAACPNAAAVVALILSADPTLTQQEAREILEKNTDKVSGYSYAPRMGQPNGSWNSEMGYGRVNALKAVEDAVLGNISLSGSNTVCTSNSFYSLSQAPTLPINWAVSSNLQIVSIAPTGVTVRAINSTVKGNGFVRATIGPKTLTKNVWVGKPNAITSLGHVSTFGCTQGEIFAFGGAGASQYAWSISGGTIVSPNVNSNSYTGPYSSIFVDPIDGPYGFTVRVTAQNTCGSASQYSKNIPTNCPIGGGGGGGGITPLGGSPMLGANNSTFFPNPVDKTLSVNLEQLIDDEQVLNFHIQLFDLNGRVVFEKHTNQTLDQINVSAFKNGVYLLYLSNGTKNITEKVTVLH
ncbi:MAG: S8 family serine peptidase [Aureispira sp.]